MRSAPGQAEKCVFKCGRSGAMFESTERIACDETAFVDDGDAVRKQLHFRQGVRGEKERSIAAPENLLFEEAAKIHGGDGVQAARRLIEKKNARLVKQGASKTEALDGAGGKCADLAVEHLAKLELLGKLRDTEIRGNA